jgi:hypothetical protein
VGRNGPFGQMRGGGFGIFLFSEGDAHRCFLGTEER